MTNRQSISIAIEDNSQVGEARRTAVNLAVKIQLNESDRGRVALAVTEMANNIFRHAKKGEIVLRSIQREKTLGMEVLGLDQGPGISNLKQCLQDGYSTHGTPGNGLGAIMRMSDLFDVFSASERGTAILTHFWPRTHEEISSNGRMVCGAVNLPYVGEDSSGDSWAVHHSPERSLFAVVDGLGHGVKASEAARKAIRSFYEHAHLKPNGILEAVHGSLRSTRGAAMAIADVDRKSNLLCYAGIGNISGVILLPRESRNLVSFNGIVGHEIHKIQEFIYPWSKGAKLVMHSDGLSARWKLDQYSGLAMRHPGLIAGILYRDFKRTRDDVTVLVVDEDYKQRTFL